MDFRLRNETLITIHLSEAKTAMAYGLLDKLQQGGKCLRRGEEQAESGWGRGKRKSEQDMKQASN